jgi:hypothetical protein
VEKRVFGLLAFIKRKVVAELQVCLGKAFSVLLKAAVNSLEVKLLNCVLGGLVEFILVPALSVA